MVDEKEVARQRRQRAIDLRELMKLPAFRRVAWWVLYRLAAIDSPSDCGESTHGTSKREGMKLVGWALGKAMLHASRELWLKMEQENLAAHLVHYDDESLAP